MLIRILYFFIPEHQIMRFEVGTAMNIKITVFLTMAVSTLANTSISGKAIPQLSE